MINAAGHFAIAALLSMETRGLLALSVDSDTGVLDDLRPACGVILDDPREFLGPVADRFQAERNKARVHMGSLCAAYNLAVELRDRIARELLRARK